MLGIAYFSFDRRNSNLNWYTALILVNGRFYFKKRMIEISFGHMVTNLGCQSLLLLAIGSGLL